MRRKTAPRFVVALWTLVLTACGVRDAVAQTRDSAGIRIVDNTQPLWTGTSGLRLSATPAVVIGTGGGEAHELSSVAGAIRLGNGTIVVADGTTRQLRVFDPSGRHLQSVGRSGRGPGEFTELGTVRKLAGDTIVAGNDFGPISFFSPSGAFVRAARPVLPSAGSERRSLTWIQAVLDDQSTVVGPVSNPMPRPAGARWIDSIPLTIIDRSGAGITPLGTHPYWVFAMHDGRPYPVRFSGEMMTTTNGREVFVGFGADYAIRVYSGAGRLERIIRRRSTPARVRGEEIDRYAAAWGKRWITATGADYERELREFRQVPFAEVVPAFSQIIADRAGRLWVREARIADASATGSLGMMPLVPSTWNVFDAAGRWLGNVTTPARFRVSEIGADYVLGVASDADGVQTVVMYRLENTR